MDPKKPPVPRRVWRMTSDAPQGEFVDVGSGPVDVPEVPVVKRTFHPETRAASRTGAIDPPLGDAAVSGEPAVRVLNPAKVPSWRASSYDLLTGLTVRDVTDTIPGAIFDELFKPAGDDGPDIRKG
jgi:hypothetical protein